MNIILCGFMGCGKSTVGRVLARYTGYRLIDMDQFIEQEQQMKIPQIFETMGEPRFREIEAAVCRTLGGYDHTVIATGGGALLRQENADALRRNGKIVLLDTPFPTILARLRKSKVNRPVIAGKNDAQIAALYQQRIGIYQAMCDLRVSVSAPPPEAAMEILGALRRSGCDCAPNLPVF